MELRLQTQLVRCRWVKAADFWSALCHCTLSRNDQYLAGRHLGKRASHKIQSYLGRSQLDIPAGSPLRCRAENCCALPDCNEREWFNLRNLSNSNRTSAAGQ